VRFWHADGRPRHIMVRCAHTHTNKNPTPTLSHSLSLSYAQVDAGKTMREQCIRILPQHGIKYIDTLLLTHAHADAIHGLDDIRDFQQQVLVCGGGGGRGGVGGGYGGKGGGGVAVQCMRM